LQRGVIEEFIACLAAVEPERTCSPANAGPFVAPLTGRVVLRFGQRTPHGTTVKGVTLQGQPSAAVRSPSSGIVLHAGEYRTYGRLVVLEVSCDLHFLLAGAGTLVVGAGDTVSASQILGHLPAGGWGDGPVLTVELRKSGKPVDPGPDIAGPP
jgi:septal ring factor EnvC (AmiA/AmiB activator)